MTIRNIALLVTIACTGCSAHDATDTTTQPLSYELPDTESGEATIADLTDTEAANLCDHLPQLSPPPQPVPPSFPAFDSVDYVSPSGSGMGMTMSDRPGGRFVLYSPLRADDCVLNLRHSSCEATVADLTNCVAFFKDNADMPVPSPDWHDLMAACGAFISTPGCDETVVQSSFLGDERCMILPISASAVPPPYCVRFAP
jgi:hypothetical protein